MSRLLQPLNEILSRYPLKTYPANSGESEEFNSYVSKVRFKFRPKSNTDQTDSTTSIKTNFNLGVYNLYPYEYDNSVYVSLDPVCLCDILVLAYKTNSKLPLVVGEETSEKTTIDSTGYVSVLSYQSSPDCELPILIEDEQNKKLKKFKRKIRDSATIDSFNLAAVTDVEELMFIKSINNKLYDFFISSIFKIDSLVLKLYSLNKFLKENDTLVMDKLTHPSILAQLASRNQLNLRYPTIASYCTGDFIGTVVKPSYFKRSLEEEIETSFLNGLAELSNLTNYYAELNSKFFFSDTKPSLFDFKLASFIYCILVLSDDCSSFQKIKPEVEKLVPFVKDVFNCVL